MYTTSFCLTLPDPVYFVIRISLYTIYPIVARRAWPTGFVQPSGRLRRASEGILHTRKKCARVGHNPTTLPYDIEVILSMSHYSRSYELGFECY